MQTYTVGQKSKAWLASIVLTLLGLALCLWLYRHGLSAITLGFTDLITMIKAMRGTDYLWFIGGLVILQEMTMVFCRYVLGRQGKKDRIYVEWKEHRFGMHHLHWGMIIALIGVIGQLTNISTNMLLIAVGLSCVLSNLMHHKVLEILHGDHEGDGPLRNPFSRKG